MICTLPFTLNPPLKCYLCELHFLGAVFGEKRNEPLPWLFNHYYQIDVFEEKSEYVVKWAENISTFVNEGVFFQKNWFILRDAAELEIIFAVIRNMLKLGYFGMGNVNEKYIPGLKAYQDYDLTHAFLIYGIDEKSNVVHTINYLADGTIGTIQVDYHDAFVALMDQKEFSQDDIFISFYRLNPDFNYDCFEPKGFLHGVEQYLSWQSNKGIQCIRYWLDMLTCQPDKETIDMRNICLFSEQKTFMANRLDYMLENGLLSDSDLVSDYHEMATGFEELKMLSLKYNVTLRPSILTNIVQKGRTYLREEESILKDAYFDCKKQITGK